MGQLKKDLEKLLIQENGLKTDLEESKKELETLKNLNKTKLMMLIQKRKEKNNDLKTLSKN